MLTPNDEILAGCQRLVDSSPGPVVLEVLIAALRTSYHLKRVHVLLTQIAGDAIKNWRGGERAFPNRDLLRHVSQVYRHGVMPEDLHFVLEMCSDPTLAPKKSADVEDLRVYWFSSLAKLKDPDVEAFCRKIVTEDLGRWTDYRFVEAMKIVARFWQPADAGSFTLISKQYPDSLTRRDAKRILQRKTT
ncbi:hypothetical protein EV138_2586 [Kribbella voronezhensis]|uniref:Uncharacterized protein n=1 Tax=Kribbella voronezhensis TaxID=2512212 RepID=A0A4R7TAI0_9ACTN|nr:hypothetical protein EV138_2586 [Kribbella voronezhensis]